MDPASSLPRTPICRQSRQASGAPAPVWAGPTELGPAPLPRRSMPTERLLQRPRTYSCSCGPPSNLFGAEIDALIHENWWLFPGRLRIRLRHSNTPTGAGGQPLRCLKNSTWRSRFLASSSDLYGPPRFLPLLESTL